MELGIGKVAPDEAEAVIPVKERLNRAARSEAEGAAEVPVLDQRELGAIGAEHVVSLADCDQVAGFRTGHPLGGAISFPVGVSAVSRARSARGIRRPRSGRL